MSFESFTASEPQPSQSEMITTLRQLIGSTPERGITEDETSNAIAKHYPELSSADKEALLAAIMADEGAWAEKVDAEAEV